MADVVADLESLTERVAAAIEAAGLSPFRDDRAAIRLTEALLDLLDQYTLDDLADLAADGRLEKAVAQVVGETFGSVRTELAADVAARTQDAIRAAAEFYQTRGVNPIPVSEAVRRSQIAGRIGDGFDTVLGTIGTKLYAATRDLTLDAVARGDVSRSSIEADLISTMGATEAEARTQASVAVGAYNEAWNEELGRQAGLSHVLYAGTLKANSRHFCRAHLGRVFTLDQIDEMDNGQLAPVRLFVGGYHCRHHLPPVDPEWSDELRARLIPTNAAPKKVALDRAGNSTMTVVLPDDEIPRLERQIVLGRRRPGEEGVYTVFENAPDNPTGFRAYHSEWLTARLNTTRVKEGFKGQNRRVMEEEDSAAEGLANNGLEVRLPPQPPGFNNLKSKQGDVDLVLFGEITEVKTPGPDSKRALSGKLDPEQAEQHVIQLIEPLVHEPTARQRLIDWLSRNPGHDVYILHRYDADRLEGPYDDRRRPE